jgi:integrase
MTRIRRLTQRMCESAMPIEAEIPYPTPKILALARHDPKVRIAAVGKGSHGWRLVKQKARWFCDGHGLYLVASPGKQPGTVNRSWMFRWATGSTIISKTGRARREQKKIGLGSLDVVDLQRARELAELCRRDVQEGRSPLAVRKAKRAAAKIAERQMHSLAQARDEYLRLHGAAWSPRHAQNWQRSFAHLKPLLDLPVSKIDRAMLIQTLKPVWEKSAPTGQRVRQRVETVLDAAGAWGWRDATIENPAAWSALKFSFRPARELVTPQHHDALPWRDAPQFMEQLRSIDSEAARGLELLILTATRTMETTEARGEEFDPDARLWTIPVSRHKTGKETGEPHVVPLSDAAVTCLRKMRLVPSKRVFPNLHGRSLYRLARDIKPGITAHGFRSTFADWAADHDYLRETTEAALNHQYGNATERAYRRTKLLEQRRKQMQDWANFLAGED